MSIKVMKISDKVGDFMQQPNEFQIKEVIRLVKNPKFAISTFNHETFDGLNVEMTKNELLQTIYLLEKKGYLERVLATKRNPKRYYLTELGKKLDHSLNNNAKN